MKRSLLAAGLIAIGVLFATLAWLLSPNAYFEATTWLDWRSGRLSIAQQNLESTLTAVQLRGDPIVDRRAIVLFGDSHLHGMPTSQLPAGSVNFAIAGETAERLARRMPRYAAIQVAERIVIMTGRNDLAQGGSPAGVAAAVAALLRTIPETTAVMLIAIPPTRRSDDESLRTVEANRLIGQTCANRPACTYLDSSWLSDSRGRLKEEYALPDGIHLSATGYKRLADRLTAQAPSRRES